MDYLGKMLKRQGTLEGDWEKKFGSLKDLNKKDWWLKEFILAAIAELCEMLQHVNYKHWKQPKPWTEERYKELLAEYADVLHFLLGIALVLELSPGKLYKIYADKANINKSRWKGGY